MEDIFDYGWEHGYYYCEECLAIGFIDELPEEFEKVQFIDCTCEKCKKKTKQYPITEHLYKLCSQLHIKKSEDEDGR